MVAPRVHKAPPQKSKRHERRNLMSRSTLRYRTRLKSYEMTTFIYGSRAWNWPRKNSLRRVSDRQ